MRDEPGNRWLYTYDSQGRRLSAQDPDHGLWTFTYDGVGNMLGQVDANNAATAFTYDAINRVTRREHFASGQTAAQEVHESRYDETRTVGGITYWNGGQLSSTTSPWGTTQHDFDANDNKDKDTWVINNQTYSITHTINAGGWLIAKSWSDGDSVGSVATPWTYDEAGRLLAIPGHITSAAYNARGQVTAVTYAKGVTTTNTEPPRVCRRLQLLRDWSHDKRIKEPEVFAGSA